MALNEKAFALAAASATAVADVGGFVWHGMLSKPSMMNSIYPGFWVNPSLLVIGLIGTVLAAYILGYIFAWVYNAQEKKR